MPTVTDMSTEELARVVSDPTRWRIVELLADEDLCVCHLTEELGAAQNLVSHHLRVLRDAGVVDSERHRYWTYYRLRPESLRPVFAQRFDTVLLGGRLLGDRLMEQKRPAEALAAFDALISLPRAAAGGGRRSSRRVLTPYQVVGRFFRAAWRRDRWLSRLRRWRAAGTAPFPIGMRI